MDWKAFDKLIDDERKAAGEPVNRRKCAAHETFERVQGILLECLHHEFLTRDEVVVDAAALYLATPEHGLANASNPSYHFWAMVFMLHYFGNDCEPFLGYVNHFLSKNPRYSVWLMGNFIRIRRQ